MSATVRILKSKSQGGGNRMTTLTIYHGDPLEDFVLHISTVFGSVNLGFQLLPGHTGFLDPRNHLSNSDSILARLNDHQEDTALLLNKGAGGREYFWHSAGLLSISSYLQAQY